MFTFHLGIKIILSKNLSSHVKVSMMKVQGFSWQWKGKVKAQIIKILNPKTFIEPGIMAL